MQTAKDIYEKNLRKLKNEEKLTLRFNICLVLLKEIEHVLKNATNTWKNVYLLHKLSDFVISVIY